jgi:glutamine amidotransferase
MKLFALMCNQPQRLPAALATVRTALVATPPVARWGLGYIQGGDVLLVRTPKASAAPVDLAVPLLEIPTDCAIAHAVSDSRFAGTDNTPPFRFRRWLFALTGAPELDEITPRLLEHVPEYLRRNLRGRTPAELMFHIFLATLADEANIDDPNLPEQVTRQALGATLRLVALELENIGRAAESIGVGNVALTNGRSMVIARPATSNQPLRLRKLWLHDDRGKPEVGPEAFRGVLLVCSSPPDILEGFEDVPLGHAVLVSRDLNVSLADLAL